MLGLAWTMTIVVSAMMAVTVLAGVDSIWTTVAHRQSERFWGDLTEALLKTVLICLAVTAELAVIRAAPAGAPWWVPLAVFGGVIAGIPLWAWLTVPRQRHHDRAPRPTERPCPPRDEYVARPVVDAHVKGRYTFGRRLLNLRTIRAAFNDAGPWVWEDDGNGVVWTRTEAGTTLMVFWYSDKHDQDNFMVAAQGDAELPDATRAEMDATLRDLISRVNATHVEGLNGAPAAPRSAG